jgi:hypothetical protein
MTLPLLVEQLNTGLWLKFSILARSQFEFHCV